MAVQDWSATPESNIGIDGVNISEGCSPANVNNALRRIMAAVRVMYDAIPNVSTLMPKAGGIFTGNPTFNGQGGYLHSVDPAALTGRVYTITLGDALPSGVAEGDLIVEL